MYMQYSDAVGARDKKNINLKLELLARKERLINAKNPDPRIEGENYQRKPAIHCFTHNPNLNR